MSLYDAIDARFSCRAYAKEPVGAETLQDLKSFVGDLCEESGLRFVLVGPEEGGDALKLNGRMFSGTVSTYLALIGPDDNETRERFGYYGEKFVLHASDRGLGTCWVAGTFDRASVVVPLGEGEVIHDVIPVGVRPPKQPMAQRAIRAALRKRDHKPEALYEGPVPLSEVEPWVRTAIEAVIKGSSAVNQQPVVFVSSEDGIRATLRIQNDVAYSDLGIAKLHFQLGAEAAGVTGSWEWGIEGLFSPDPKTAE